MSSAGLVDSIFLITGSQALRVLACSDLLAELNQRVRRAVALPVRIAVKDVYDETCTELLISAPLDSGAPHGAVPFHRANLPPTWR